MSVSFFSPGFLARPQCKYFPQLIFLEVKSQYFVVWFAAFSPQNVTSLDAGLDGKI